ncbi:MAG: glycogen synthase, partial [Deltaproteobacteria bacterium CG1_02_45_11]
KTSVSDEEFETIQTKMPDDRVHLAEDRAFFYLHQVYAGHSLENIKISLSFQREVINNIVPRVRPDLIHCNDWMTGLLPAMARQIGIPALFTVHNIYTMRITLEQIEDRGIDAAYFWHYLYYQHMANEYEETRETNSVDLLTSGIFAAHFVNTVSPTFLKEIVDNKHDLIEPPIRQELINKWNAGCAYGILNAPDPSFNPATDKELYKKYPPKSHLAGKKTNKLYLQKHLGLIQDGKAPVFFWPSRLDTIQKGCQLLADILYQVVSRYWEQNLQIIFVANGEFQQHFRNIVAWHHFENRVSVCNFNEKLARAAYAASDFVLMPSRFEPCGLPQMIGPIYGALPVAHDTGGIHDTIVHMNVAENKGNGFLFNVHDSNGLLWAIDQAMQFYRLPLKIKEQQIKRVMTESIETFNHAVTARQYIDLYEEMLQRPLVN